MITLENAEKALKDVYLDVVANQLNMNANPLLGKIRQSTGDVWGKKIIKAISYGINGGIGAGTEDGALPLASGNNYLNFQARNHRRTEVIKKKKNRRQNLEKF